MKLGILRRRWVPHGGGERLAQDFLRSVAQAGYEVHLFCEAWTAAPPGVVIHRVPRLGRGGTLGTLGYAWLAPRLARAAGVALVHSFERTLAQDLYRAGEGCHRQWLDLRDRRRPEPLRSLGRCRPFHRAVLSIERSICQRGAARVLVVNSRMVERDFGRHYQPLVPQVALVRNGVNLTRFHPDARAAGRAGARAALELAADDVALLTVGSGFARKGVTTVIRALGELRRRHDRVPTLLIAGRGRAGPLRRLAAVLGVDGSVRFLGVTPDVTPLLVAADVFVLASVYDPASSATLEALAMGLPVITTTSNGSAELIDHDRSGWLLDDADDAATLAALIAGAAEPSAGGRVGAAGRQAVAPWTWERHVSETVALYAGFAAGRRAATAS